MDDLQVFQWPSVSCISELEMYGLSSLQLTYLLLHQVLTSLLLCSNPSTLMALNEILLIVYVSADTIQLQKVLNKALFFPLCDICCHKCVES